MPNPIIVFETHLQDSAPKLINQEYEYLMKNGYSCFCLEMPKDFDLEKALKWCSDESEQLKTKAFPDAQRRRNNVMAKFRMLLNIKVKGLNYVGVDLTEQEKAKLNTENAALLLKTTKNPSFFQNPANMMEIMRILKEKALPKRDEHMADEFIKKCKEHKNGVVMILGDGHVGVLNVIKQKDPELYDAIKPFYIYSTKANQETEVEKGDSPERKALIDSLVEKIDIDEGMDKAEAMFKNKIASSGIKLRD